MEFIYSIVSVFIVSVIAFLAVYILAFKDYFKNVLIYFVSFAAGALFGDVFFHLLPEYVRENSFTSVSASILLIGIIVSFITETILHWRHCHNPTHNHTLAHMNLFGDAIHNFIDGIIIGAAFLVNIPAGIATTFAVTLHEIPQEMGDAAVLLHSGFNKSKALLFNFYVALTALLGVAVVFFLGSFIHHIEKFILPFAMGNFLYIAGSDLIPELHKDITTKKAIIQVFMLIFGMLTMSLLLLLD